MPTKRSYNKPATTYLEQVEKLRSRGMTIANEESAKFYLQHINYYRLGAYWLPFEADHGTHQFRPGTAFDDVLKLYSFDRELRLLLLDAIERVEVSVRSQWAYSMGHSHGAHAHLDSRLAVKHYHWQKNVDDLKKEVERADEIFIQHLINTYSEALPPVWAVCEVMSLGLLSRWYANLKPMHTRRLIAGIYGLDESVLASWLHHLSVVRNICAHHSRLWNREFTILPKAPRTKPAALVNEFTAGNRIYNTLIILLYLMDKISPGHHWRGRLKALLINNEPWISDMNFPADWKNHAIWQ